MFGVKFLPKMIFRDWRFLFPLPLTFAGVVAVDAAFGGVTGATVTILDRCAALDGFGVGFGEGLFEDDGELAKNLDSVNLKF